MLPQVDANNFVNIVENLAKEGTIVVVHLFDPSLAKSIQLHEMLVSLATVEFQRTKFLCLDISESKIEVDKVALPMLQLYQNGELVDTIAPVHLEVLISSASAFLRSSHLSFNFFSIYLTKCNNPEIYIHEKCRQHKENIRDQLTAISILTSKRHYI